MLAVADQDFLNAIEADQNDRLDQKIHPMEACRREFLDASLAFGNPQAGVCSRSASYIAFVGMFGNVS